MISIQHLSFRFSEDSPEVLKDINLNIESGDFVAVLGRNGSGKSTLARQMNGLLQPTSGTVKILGMDTQDESKLWEIRQNLGLVFQNPDNQIVATVVEDDVAFGPENLGVLPAEIRHRVDWALKTVGMYEHRFKAPHLLSGGQKQRVAIAGVLAMKPKCIVFDEPTAMLDPVGREEVLSTIQKINRDERITIILITHNMDEAALAKRAIVMDAGRIVADAAPIDIFRDIPLMEKCGLEVPDTVALMEGLRKRGYPVSDLPLSADTCIQALKNMYFALE